MRNHIFTIFAFSLVVCFSANIAYPVTPQVGDLLFKEYPGDNSFIDAITTSTSSINSYNFSHVGIVTKSDRTLTVTEAVGRGVMETPLDSFLLSARMVKGQPIVVVARLKPQYRASIDSATIRLKAFLGKPYDVRFLPDNDSYYCSELVYEAFQINGKHIFEAKPMSFKDKKTGEISDLWLKYFEKLECPVPEGVPGTNPGDLSKSEAIDILGLIDPSK